MEHAVQNPWVGLAYLIAGVCFILALRGLSSPSTSQSGNRYGMIGMLIAVVTTLVTHVPQKTITSSITEDPGTFARIEAFTTTPDYAAILQILGAIAIGAVIGIVTARRIKMTDMPQLVAAFHSLVGMAAVLVGVAAFLNPEAFGILDSSGNINPVSRIEAGLGVAIGAITFSGSVIAFLKLAGKMSGAPIILPLRHIINLGTLAAILILIAVFAHTNPVPDWAFWTIVALSFLIGFLLIIPTGMSAPPIGMINRKPIRNDSATIDRKSVV